MTHAQPPEAPQWTAVLLQERRSTLPKRLTGPGPDEAQRQAILQAAASAPDHDQILPWRLVQVPAERRQDLGQAFEDALLARDPDADDAARTQAREKALRSPWLLLLVVRTGGEPAEIPASERLLSAGAAVQNMMLMATAFGLGTSLTSGKALQSTELRRLFKLHADEQAICFLNVGHIRSQREARLRPEVARYVSTLGPAQA
jgi:nitroreductase